MLNVYDAILPITQDDADVFVKMGCRIPILVTPIGADVSALKSYIMSKLNCVFFIWGQWTGCPMWKLLNGF